jgi:hypothetical protein
MSRLTRSFGHPARSTFGFWLLLVLLSFALPRVARAQSGAD